MKLNVFKAIRNAGRVVILVPGTLCLIPVMSALASGSHDSDHQDHQDHQLSGTHCFTATITDTTVQSPAAGSTFPMVTNIVRLGGQSYAMAGYSEVQNDNPVHYSGIGEVVNGTLFLNLAGSQQHVDAWRDTSVMHIEFNTSAHSGTGYANGNDFNSVTHANNLRYTAFSFVETSCQ